MVSDISISLRKNELFWNEVLAAFWISEDLVHKTHQCFPWILNPRWKNPDSWCQTAGSFSTEDCLTTCLLDFFFNVDTMITSDFLCLLFLNCSEYHRMVFVNSKYTPKVNMAADFTKCPKWMLTTTYEVVQIEINSQSINRFYNSSGQQYFTMWIEWLKTTQ